MAYIQTYTHSHQQQQSQNQYSQPSEILQQTPQSYSLLVDQSSNIKAGVQVLNALVQRLTYHNLLEALNQIKQKECLLLKCQILTKTINKIFDRSIEDTKRVCYQKINGGSGIRLDTHSHFDFKVKHSLETSIGLESVAWSLEIQKTKVLCQNCRKQITTKITTASRFQITDDSAGIEYTLKEPLIIQPGVFAPSQHIPKKIINLLPDDQLHQVQDKNASFINLQIPLYVEATSKLIQSPHARSQPQLFLQLPISSIKKIQSQKQNSPSSNIMQQIKQQIRHSEPITFNHQVNIPELQAINNELIKFPTIQIEKSFIDKLKIEESRHGLMSPKYEKGLRNLQLATIPSDNMLESQIFPVNYQNRDQFMRSIQLNRTTPSRTYSLPKTNHYYHQRFTDSQIKYHLFNNNNRKAATAQSFKVQHRRQVQERVGGTRSHIPTFFQTAYYF